MALAHNLIHINFLHMIFLPDNDENLTYIDNYFQNLKTQTFQLKNAPAPDKFDFHDKYPDKSNLPDH